VAENHNRLQAVAEVIARIAQTAEDVAAEPVAGDADDEQVVRTLAVDQLDRNPDIGTDDALNRKWTLSP
jgi:hypothetical protein